MKKQTTKPSKKALGTKIVVGAAMTILAASTAIMAVSYDASQDRGVQLSENLAKVNASLDALNISYSSTVLNNSNLKVKLDEALAAHNVTLEKFDNETIAKNEVIKDYAELEAELVTATAEPAEFMGFSEDELALDYSGTLSVDNNDFEKLGDYEIDFDGEDIDVVETLAFSGAFASNDKDFNGETMYKLADGQVEYKVSFDANMTALDYDEDVAEFSFLGEPMKVKEWTSNSVTLEGNDEFSLVEKETVNGVTLDRIGESAVLVTFDGVTKSISEGNSYDFGDIEVEVESIFYIDGAADNTAFLKISEDLDATIEDGDEFEGNDNYEYVITEDSIGLKLVEDFDEDDSALKEGDSFVLPNDFAALSFELSTENMNKVDVEYESDTEVTFKGDFEDAEGDVVFNGTAFIDEDDEVFTSVQLKDSDYKIEFDGTDFVVGDISFAKNVSSLAVNGNDETSTDDNVKSVIGIEVSAPEDDLQDGELSFEVPEEAIEATLKVE